MDNPSCMQLATRRIAPKFATSAEFILEKTRRCERPYSFFQRWLDGTSEVYVCEEHFRVCRDYAAKQGWIW
jgi:hypothetical protein